MLPRTCWPSNIRLGWKWLTVTNTPVCNTEVLFIAAKFKSARKEKNFFRLQELKFSLKAPRHLPHWHSGQWHSACQYKCAVECCNLNITLNVIIMSVIMLRVLVLIFMLTVMMLTVVVLKVVILSVLCSLEWCWLW